MQSPHRRLTATPVRAAALGLLLGLNLLAGPVARAVDRGVTPEEVRQAIAKGLAALQGRGGFFGRSNEQGQVLTCMALLNCGVSAQDAALSADIAQVLANSANLTRQQYHGTYEAGLILSLLAMVRDPKYRKTAEELTVRLYRDFQAPNGGWGDNSRTQFALLGLKAAEDLGIPVPPGVFERAKQYLESGQNQDGGWGYQPKAGKSYGSMTVAGVSGLYICGARLYKSGQVCGEGRSDKRLQAGIAWLTWNFSVRTNPAGGGHHYYYLYGLERIGVLLAQKNIGTHDWYREGAEYLVAAQNPDGRWGGDQYATEFAMLFLGKGSQPVAVQKLDYGGDWNTDPYDAKYVVERAAKDLATPMTFQTVTTSAAAEELAAAPILYIQGHRAIPWTKEFREKLRLFVDQGGFVVASACCGRAEFDKSFREELKAIFPEASLEVLPPDHQVYHARHHIAAPEAFMVEGLNTGCRTSVLYCPRDVCCAWGQCVGCRDARPVTGETALQLGVNFIAYALDFQRLRDKLEDVKFTAARDDRPIARGTLVVGQVYHGGGWNPGPAAIPNLTQTLREQAGLRTEVAKRRVTIGADDLGDYPVLYITGFREFSFTPEQIRILREYLDKGGYLFGDPWCGRPEFDKAFRALVKALYPDKEFVRLPLDHVLLREPFHVERVEYKEPVKKKFPEIEDKPYLEYISHKNRIPLVYSRFNLGCELQGIPMPQSLGVKGPDAYRLAVDMLLYGLSH